MSGTKRSLALGTSWSILFFIFFFAKTIVVIPFMLDNWGEGIYTFWVLLLSIKMIIHFLSEGYIRYAINHYNLTYHVNKRAAIVSLNSSLSFLVIYSILFQLALIPLSLYTPAIAYMFHTTTDVAKQYHLGWTLFIYTLATAVQNIVRLGASVKEPSGKYWQNMVFEICMLATEISIIVGLLLMKQDFTTVVIANSTAILIVSLIYFILLKQQYPLQVLNLKPENIKSGAKIFYKSGPFNINNFFEKISNESLPFILAVFKFPVGVIPLYATMKTFANAPVLANNMISGAFLPEMQKSYIEKNTGKLLQLFTTIWILFGVVITTGIVALYPFYDDIYIYWTQGTITFDIIFLAILLINSMVILYGSCYVLFLKGINAMKKLLAGTISKGLLLLMLLYILPRQTYTIVYALLAAEALCNFVIYFVVTANHIKRMHTGNPFLVFIRGAVPYLLSTITLLLFIYKGFHLILFAVYVVANIGFAIYTMRRFNIQNYLGMLKRRF